MDSMLNKPLALSLSIVGLYFLLHWSLLAGFMTILFLISTAITFTIARIVIGIRLAKGGMPRIRLAQGSMPRSLATPNASMLRWRGIRAKPVPVDDKYARGYFGALRKIQTSSENE